jgi:hypothetical protein
MSIMPVSEHLLSNTAEPFLYIQYCFGLLFIPHFYPVPHFGVARRSLRRSAKIVLGRSAASLNPYQYYYSCNWSTIVLAPWNSTSYSYNCSTHCNMFNAYSRWYLSQYIYILAAQHVQQVVFTHRLGQCQASVLAARVVEVRLVKNSSGIASRSTRARGGTYHNIGRVRLPRIQPIPDSNKSAVTSCYTIVLAPYCNR